MSSENHVVSEQHAQIKVLNQAQDPHEHTAHPDAQWFASAGLGVFIHWGISAVQGEGDLSWSMMKRTSGYRQQSGERYGPFAVQRTIPPHEYWQQAEHFLAENYDPNQWMMAFKAAGVRYAVLTTKHHDGYALWPSEYGDFSTKTHLNGRDLVGEFVTACRAHGIKIGFYYSPPDWWFDREVMSFHYGDAKPDLDMYHEPVDLAVMAPEALERHAQARREFVKAQTEELLTRYGPIDILWFDGSADAAISLERIRELQPHILVNRRGLGLGDFETPECAFPSNRISGWWEYCHIWNDGAWGYLRHETYKPLGWATGELAKARSWGGNFLLNIGPNARGELPHTAYRRFEQLGRWLEVHHEAVFDVEPGPWPQQANVPVTVRDSVWYLHIHFLVDYPVVLTGVDLPERAYWLATGEEAAFVVLDGEVVFRLPSGKPTIDGDVIVVRWS
jgi:alpha-L-fucosidase